MAEIFTDTKLSKIIKAANAVLVTDFNYGVGVKKFDDYRLLLMKKLYRAENTTIVHIENGLAAFFEPVPG
ncbi:MAG: hypothetical protein U5K79_08785 [Cyclobacteriaceae bacterium]|nr:hypothetical protein [Cyclobacteriaceae bacterium]